MAKVTLTAGAKLIEAAKKPFVIPSSKKEDVATVVQYVEVIKEVEKIVDRPVEVEKIVEVIKTKEVPVKVIEYVDRIKEVPVEVEKKVVEKVTEFVDREIEKVKEIEKEVLVEVARTPLNMKIGMVFMGLIILVETLMILL